MWPHIPVGSGMEMHDDFTPAPGVLAAEWLGTNVQREQKTKNINAKVFHLLLGLIQLSPLTPGGCWHELAAVAAGKVTLLFSQAAVVW